MMCDVSTAGKCTWFVATLESRGSQITSKDDGGWYGLPFEDIRFLERKKVCVNQSNLNLNLNLSEALFYPSRVAGKTRGWTKKSGVY